MQKGLFVAISLIIIGFNFELDKPGMPKTEDEE
jgi:hypothetical protein